MKPRLWVSFDANFWRGGRISLNGVENQQTLQTSYRIGVTASIPLSKHQSLKVNYHSGVYSRCGGSYQSVSLAWQFSLLGRPARTNRSVVPRYGQATSSGHKQKEFTVKSNSCQF